MRVSRSCRVLMFGALLLVLCTGAFAQVRITVGFGPPAIPVYEQPICPGDGYMWVPGYWAWDADFDDYYWVPGTWVLAPEVGYLWTPPWWGWDGGVYLFHEGFWGPTIGFYGGINYGFGYYGTGYVGGRWNDGHFFYNRSITNVNVTVIHNVYNERVEVRNESHVSFNGGQGGLSARPTGAEEAAERERHVPAVAAQMQNRQAARGNTDLRANANHGRPPVAATAHPGDFRGSVVAAREAGGEYHRPANAGGAEPHGASAAPSRPAVHPNDLPALNRPEAGNASSKDEQKYQQQQQKLYQQQTKQRQKLQQQQEKEHTQLQRQNASQQKQQQMEQRHQQQTEKMQQRQDTQTRNLQARPGGQRPR
jgi:hypothetical protein